MLPEATHLAIDAGALAGVNILLWLVSLPLGKVWPVDFIWSGWPPVQCILILARAFPQWQSGGAEVRRLLTCVLVAVWGWRLTCNFVARGGVGHEDWRYANMRRQLGRHFWWASLFSVFLGQTIFMFGPCLALYGALLGSRPLDACDAWAASVCAGAILLEAAADMQMDAFQAARREKRSDACILETGLWAWSRHPNYLGEVLWWWGLWLFGVREAEAWVVAGPLLITALFLGVSIKLLEDRQLEHKGDAYREYRTRVPSTLLLVPPPVGRWLGRRLCKAGGRGLC